jgi:cephalosporin-C deacetylase
MAFFDMTPEELGDYTPEVREPEDFDQFWIKTLADSRIKSADPQVTAISSGVREFSVSDLRFSGYSGDEIAAWLVRPKNPIGVVIEYNGYGGGRSFPHERLQWAAAGYSYVFMDTRGQGSAWGSGGVTPDNYGSAPAGNGFMTKGIDAPENYYYRRVFTDAALLVDAVRKLDLGSDQIILAGGSQGGGITLAAAGLVDGIHAVLPDVPFLCHFERSITLTDGFPYKEIANYLSVHRDKVDSVLHTLSYFDGVNFAKRATAPALFSAGLMDQICPPSTVFAAKNHYAAKSLIQTYPFNGHEGGQGHHFLKQLEWLAGTK